MPRLIVPDQARALIKHPDTYNRGSVLNPSGMKDYVALSGKLDLAQR